MIFNRLETHVHQHPKRTQGWYLLGRLYASQHQWKNAQIAFEHAHVLDPHDKRITVNWAQSLFILATDAYQKGQYQDAINNWQHLLTLIPPESEEAKNIRRMIRKLKPKSQRK